MRKPEQDLNLPDELTFINMGKISALLDKNPSTIYRWIQGGKFPELQKLSGGSSGLRLSEYRSWAADPEGWRSA